MESLERLHKATIKGDKKTAVAMTQEAIDEKVSPEDILEAMTTAMDVIGEGFKKGKVFVPEMLFAARAMKESMRLLEPLLAVAGVKKSHTVLIGTVEGDLHDIGKNLVAMMWKGANFDVIDLGTNVTPADFVAAAKEHNAPLIGLSALLTTTMSAMQATVEAIQVAGLSDIKVMVGGAPVTQVYADEIGADGFAQDAASAVDMAKDILAA